MTRAYAYLGAIVAIAAIVGAIYWHGVTTERERQAARAANDRLEHISDAKGKKDAAESLDDNGLIDALGRWLLPADNE